MILMVLIHLLGVAGGAFGLYGYYTGNFVFWVVGIVVAALLCWLADGSILKHFLVRVILFPLFSVPGMLICHFVRDMAWVSGFFLCYNWVITAIALYSVIISVADLLTASSGD